MKRQVDHWFGSAQRSKGAFLNTLIVPPFASVVLGLASANWAKTLQYLIMSFGLLVKNLVRVDTSLDPHLGDDFPFVSHNGTRRVVLVELEGEAALSLLHPDVLARKWGISDPPLWLPKSVHEGQRAMVAALLSSSLPTHEEALCAISEGCDAVVDSINDPEVSQVSYWEYICTSYPTTFDSIPDHCPFL